MAPAGGDKSFPFHCSFPRPGHGSELRGRRAGPRWAGQRGNWVLPEGSWAQCRTSLHLPALTPSTHPHPRSPSEGIFSQELGLGAQADLAIYSASQPTFPRARRSTPGGKERGLDLTHPITTGEHRPSCPASTACRFPSSHKRGQPSSGSQINMLNKCRNQEMSECLGRGSATPPGTRCSWLPPSPAHSLPQGAPGSPSP